MQYRLLFLCFIFSFTYPLGERKFSAPTGTQNPLFFTPRNRSFKIPASLLRSPAIARIAGTFTSSKKPVSLVTTVVVMAAAKAFSFKRQALPITTMNNPKEAAQVKKLRDDISDILKIKQREHLIQRGYSPLAPTTFSGHFELYFPPEKLHQILQTKEGKAKLVAQLEKNYFFGLNYEKKRIKELEEEQQILQRQQQPSSWWQPIKNLIQKPPQQQIELAAQLTKNQAEINSRKKNILEEERQFQTITRHIDTTRIEAVD